MLGFISSNSFVFKVKNELFFLNKTIYLNWVAEVSGHGISPVIHSMCLIYCLETNGLYSGNATLLHLVFFAITSSLILAVNFSLIFFLVICNKLLLALVCYFFSPPYWGVKRCSRCFKNPNQHGGKWWRTVCIFLLHFCLLSLLSSGFPAGSLVFS